VDVDACTKAGVLVTIQPDGVRRPVAVAALTLVLALSQKLIAKHTLTRAGRWSERLQHLGEGLIGRTLGVVGAGSIGKELLALARPFGFELLAADPLAEPGVIAGLGAEHVALEALLARSDYVVLLVPLTPQTRGLIGAAQLAGMKRTAFLVNIARGPVVDEAALIAALQNGTIAGAALDVFEQEPVDAANLLLGMDNVIVTPHALCWTDQCFAGIAESGFRSLLNALDGAVPKNAVNPEAVAGLGR
jgi:phosphoglycerate dehydrogenase-like enzyme